MWEIDSVKGKKKLKKEAVLTIFGDLGNQVNIPDEIGKVSLFTKLNVIERISFFILY